MPGTWYAGKRGDLGSDAVLVGGHALVDWCESQEGEGLVAGLPGTLAQWTTVALCLGRTTQRALCAETLAVLQLVPGMLRCVLVRQTLFHTGGYFVSVCLPLFWMLVSAVLDMFSLFGVVSP